MSTPVPISEPATYRDLKRPAWMLSLAVPLLVGIGPLAIAGFGAGVGWLWAPVVFVYGAGPLFDALLGADRSNPPESAVPALEQDRYYRRVTYALLPLLWAMFVLAAWFATTPSLPLHARLALVLTTGMVGGFGINLGHELGHKLSKLEQRLALVALAPTGYGHFCVEHNRGHHRHVATPQDCASARMGESICRFLLREMPGAFLRAWELEASRLRLRGLQVLSWHNDIVLSAALTALLWTALVLWLGWTVLPFLLLASFWANFQLTTANYIEHYGLLRGRLPDGRLEPCTPRHSWNSNHVFSNWALFHLQRHADHHAHPGRRYQSLRHFDDAPQLPSGYFAMFPVAYVPPLWFALMDRRLVNAVQGDASLVNFDPLKRERLLRRWFAES